MVHVAAEMGTSRPTTHADWAYVGNYVHGPHVTGISPGTPAAGAIDLLSHDSNGYKYQVSFAGYQEAELRVVRGRGAGSLWVLRAIRRSPPSGPGGQVLRHRPRVRDGNDRSGDTQLEWHESGGQQQRSWRGRLRDLTSTRARSSAPWAGPVRRPGRQAPGRRAGSVTRAAQKPPFAGCLRLRARSVSARLRCGRGGGGACSQVYLGMCHPYGASPLASSAMSQKSERSGACIRGRWLCGGAPELRAGTYRT